MILLHGSYMELTKRLMPTNMNMEKHISKMQILKHSLHVYLNLDMITYNIVFVHKELLMN